MIFDLNPWQLDVDIDLTKQFNYIKKLTIPLIKHLIWSLLKVYRQSNKCFFTLWGLT